MLRTHIFKPMKKLSASVCNYADRVTPPDEVGYGWAISFFNGGHNDNTKMENVENMRVDKASFE